MIDDHVKISLDEQLNIRAAGTYFVKAEGDSMQGVGIYSGDILIVDKGIDSRAGHVVIAVVNREPLVKLLSFDVSGKPILRSANPRYPNRYIMENDEFEVWEALTVSGTMPGTDLIGERFSAAKSLRGSVGPGVCRLTA